MSSMLEKLKRHINEELYSTYPLGDILDDFKFHTCYRDKNKRGNCGYVAISLIDYLKSKGINAKRVRGRFKVDIPDTGLKSFTSEQIKEMRDIGLNIHEVTDRIRYAKEKEIYDELFLIPHFWVKTKKYGIIDPTVKQFAPFLLYEIGDKNYIKEQKERM